MTAEQAKDELLNIVWFDIDSGPRGDSQREAISMAIQSLDQTWIPLSERPPEEEKRVYISLKYDILEDDERVCIGHREKWVHVAESDEYVWFVEGSCCVFHDDVIAAWMPLPEPYKAESEE